MKKILLSAFAMLLAVTANAQNLTVEKLQSPLGVQTEAFGAHKAPAKVKVAKNERVVGFYDDIETCDNYLGLTTVPGNNKIGVLFTAKELAPYYGKKIVGVRFNLAQGETSTGIVIENVKFKNNEISELKTLATSNKSVTSAVGPKNTGEWHEVMFDNKIELSSSIEGLLVGYNYTQKSNNYPFGAKSNATSPLFIFANIPASGGGHGEDWYQLNAGDKALAIQLILEGATANSVLPLDFNKTYVPLGTTKDVTVKLNNKGSKLTSIDYTLTIDGKTGAEQHLDLGKDYGANVIHEVKIPFAAASTNGEYPATLTITKVNGENNACEESSATGTLITRTKEFKKYAVVEENTGTNCPWCVRGHAGLEMMQKQYGDQFIAIAWHYFDSADPMYNTNYKVPKLSYGAAPQAVVNRSTSAIDPYLNAPTYVAKILEDHPVAEVKVNGVFAEEDTKVNATASVESLVSGDYDIIFALTANGVIGNDEKWLQENAYAKEYSGAQGTYKSKEAAPDELQPYWDKGTSYKTAYNDVLIASSFVSKTNKATLPTLVENGIVNTEYTLKMPTKVDLKEALKLDQVYVVAMLLDKTSGKIINAGKARVTGSTGIEDVTTGTEATVVARYTVNGVQVSAPVKGVNILKMSDGTTRKVLVK